MKSKSSTNQPNNSKISNKNNNNNNNNNTSTLSTATTSKPQRAKADSIETIARRFLHDFRADSAKSDVHDADRSAWWACSLRESNKQANNNNPSGRAASSSGKSSKTNNNNNALAAPALTLAAAAEDGNNTNISSASKPNLESTRKRTEQLTAFARDGCGSKFAPSISSQCSGQKRWDPSTSIVSTEDPLYALLHRRLQQEGFAEDFESAQQNFNSRIVKSEAKCKKDENARKDRELQWYLEVYRPKQKREALLEVEQDSRLEISEEEMTAFMRMKQKFWEITRQIQLKEHRRQQREEAERIADAKRREAEERHVREYLSRMHKQLFEQEAKRRQEIVLAHENVILNLFEYSAAEREKMARIRLAQLNRLKIEFNHIASAEKDRRKSIEALEETALKHLAQLAITERSEFFTKQRLNIYQECISARKETFRSEVEERGKFARQLIVGRSIISGLNAIGNEEEKHRKKIESERSHELANFYKAAELSKHDAQYAVFTQQIVDIENEFFDSRDEILEEEKHIFENSIFSTFVNEQRQLILKLSHELIAQEEADREKILNEYHHFVVHRARLEATSINMMSEETEGRYLILDEEHLRIKSLVRSSLLTSCVAREQAQRSAVEREEHQAASRLIVEAAILRDNMASERKDMFARQRSLLEREEHDARHDFVSDHLETLSKLVDDAMSRLNELNRAQEAKLLQQALRLTSSFVGIGLAERGEYLQVETLVEGGPGQHSGLRLGDMVISIGGIPVSSTLEMRSALKRTGFVSKYLEVIIRRFIPEDGFDNMETIRMESAPLLPTQRPNGKFLDDIEKISVLVSTTDPKFKRFPFYFDSKKTMRICLPLVDESDVASTATTTTSSRR